MISWPVETLLSDASSRKNVQECVILSVNNQPIKKQESFSERMKARPDLSSGICRIGIFEFGSLLLSRPVAVTV